MELIKLPVWPYSHSRISIKHIRLEYSTSWRVRTLATILNQSYFHSHMWSLSIMMSLPTLNMLSIIKTKWMWAKIILCYLLLIKEKHSVCWIWDWLTKTLCIYLIRELNKRKIYWKLNLNCRVHWIKIWWEINKSIKNKKSHNKKCHHPSNHQNNTS